eukprot:1154704-Rhodomonas_salina.2
MLEEEGGGLGSGRSMNPFETDAGPFGTSAHDEPPTGSNAEQAPSSADNGKKRRKLHRKGDDPNYHSERQRFYRKRRQGRFYPTHPDADLQKYSGMQHGFKFLDAHVVVVASPDKSITANLKDSVKDCA